MLKRFLMSAVLLGAFLAWAADEAKCVIPVNVTTATSTSTCVTDGGCWTGNGSAPRSASCSGMSTVLQCNVDIYVDPTNSSGGTATSSDFKIEFTNNKDPAYIYLKPTQTNLSLLAVTADGGCTIGVTDRRKPL